jgi:hypothetical protein
MWDFVGRDEIINIGGLLLLCCCFVHYLVSEMSSSYLYSFRSSRLIKKL